MGNGGKIAVIGGILALGVGVTVVLLNQKKGTTPPPGVTLVSISIAPDTFTSDAGITRQYTATGTYSDGSTRDITSTVTWECSPETVATISANGLVTCVAAGAAKISANLSGIQSEGASLTVTTPIQIVGQGQLKVITNDLILTNTDGQSQAIVAELYIPEIDFLGANIDPLGSLDAGDYTLIISQLHYVPQLQHITIRTNQTTTVNVNLVSTTQFCNLYDVSTFDTWDQLKEYIEANFPSEPVPWPY